MSSKFKPPSIHFKTPPVCKKSPKGPPISLTTPETMDAWYRFDGIDSMGSPVSVNTLISLPLIPGPFPFYQQIQIVAGDRWEFTYSKNGPNPTWLFAGIRGEEFAPATIVTQKGDVEPITTEPMNSGIITLTSFLGSGLAQARILF